MSIMTLSPNATGLFAVKEKSGCDYEESTHLWGIDDSGERANFGDILGSIAMADGPIRIATRVVRDSGVLRITKSLDDNLNVVIVNTTAATVDPADITAVDAVKDLASRLGVSERSIEAAAGIHHSTYSNWKRNPATQPRAGSEGALWSLIAAVTDLEVHLGTSKSAEKWVKEDRSRLAALKAGQIRRHIDLETRALRTAENAIVHVELRDEDTTDENTALAAEPASSPNARGESWSIDDFESEVVPD